MVKIIVDDTHTKDEILGILADYGCPDQFNGKLKKHAKCIVEAPDDEPTELACTCVECWAECGIEIIVEEAK